MSLISNIWNWISGKPNIPDIPPNIIFEKDVTPDNDFWISCILDPTLEIKYVNGIVTKIIDTDKCIINGIYHYQPKTDKEIRNFPYIEQNSSVRISLYRKKNSDMGWKVASCFLSRDGPCHQANLIRQNDSIRVHLNHDEPTVEVNDTDENDEESLMTVEVLGDMPKVVNFEGVTTLQILFRNDSYVKEQELLDYLTMQTNKAQLSIVNKRQMPLIISVQSQHIFDINITGKYLGRSTEKVEFIFKDITYKVGVNIDVTDSRIIIPHNIVYNPRVDIDMQRVFELQNDNIVPGVRLSKRVQFPAVKLKTFNIPHQLQKCFWNEDSKFIIHTLNEVEDNINKLYPAVFETLTYQNYKAKFHTLLFMDEIEVTISLQKYAHERIHFEHKGDYLVLKIPDLSEQRPSLIHGDRVMVTDPPNCTKRLGEFGKYEGIIHKVTADEVWLKFDPEFHSICGHWDYSVNFFNTRMIYRKQHEVVDLLWSKNRLGESFLFPYKDSLEYKPPKLEILSLNEKNADTNCEDNLNGNGALLPKPKIIQKIRWFNGQLNKEQKSAVINILKGEGRPMPYIIYGPPGTGKTVTLTEAIIQVYKAFPSSKLLVCAPTNAAVDMLLIKLVNFGLFDKTVMKRLVGYNHFISQNYDMNYDEYCVLPELDTGTLVPYEKDSKLIKKKDILKLRIVITTEGTAGLLFMMGLKRGVFSHIFIDEAGQSTEPETLLPLSFLDPYKDGQVVLAGDPKQLGPVVMSSLAKKNGLGQSMLGRFINYPSYLRDPVIFPEFHGYNPKVITHLVQNYRSVPEIVHLFSSLFYKSLLVATKVDDDVKEKIMLKNLNENIHWGIDCKGPIIVHGVEGEDRQEPSSPSWFNPHEAFQVLLYVTRLLKAGISADDIGVITPYASQVSKINELFKMYHTDIKLPKVGTVEMFQGQENMIIIISMVRSKSVVAREKDKKFHLGFLAAKERTNVALSRAKALLIIIGDPSTMLSNDKWKKVLMRAISKNNYIGCNVLPYGLKHEGEKQKDS